MLSLLTDKSNKMRKKFSLFEKYAYVFLVLSVSLLTACVNSISDDEVSLPAEGTVPISFTGKVSKSTSTRVSDKALEVGDRVGLMAMLSGTPISGQRYIDNLLLETSTDNALIPEKVVYYPEGADAKLDFVAYHPYRSEGLPGGDSKMTVSVMLDQSIESNWDKSDFLVASKEKVSASTSSVTLLFKHKLAKVKVELIPENGDLDALLGSNPSISACGFCTQTVYDFTTGSFSSPSAAEVIRMAGTWKKSSDKLVGKEMIVVPQEISADKQYLVLELNGKMYTCKISAATLDSNTQRVITIRVKESLDKILPGMVGNVEDWGEESVQEGESGMEYQLTDIHTALLSFAESNIYHLFVDGKIVAEVCKEYLRLPDAGIDSQALVLYQAEEGVVDLKQGTVLELFDVEGNVHGGQIGWDVETGQVQYTPGTSAPVHTFYINAQSRAVLEKPEQPLTVHLKNYQLQDIRGNEVSYYGVVKIGTQYWMQEELNTTKYADGKALTLRTETGTGAGYFESTDKNHIFYNGEAIVEGELAPAGWRIPKIADWNTLVNYVGKVAALKAGEWESLSGGELAPATNRSFFNAYPVGMCAPKSYGGVGKINGFHSLDEAGTAVEKKSLILVGDIAEYTLQSTFDAKLQVYKGCSIRCLRK